MVDKQKSIEEEFSASWDSMERFYKGRSYHENGHELILNLIGELRKGGYDKKFRAGQILDRFVLSRSQNHGLRYGQANLGFDIYRDGRLTVVYFEVPDVEIELNIESVQLNPEIQSLLSRLLEHPID